MPHSETTSRSGKIDWADDAAIGQYKFACIPGVRGDLIPQTAGEDTQREEGDFDENGIKTVVEYRTDAEGKKIKVRSCYRASSAC